MAKTNIPNKKIVNNNLSFSQKITDRKPLIVSLVSLGALVILLFLAVISSKFVGKAIQTTGELKDNQVAPFLSQSSLSAGDSFDINIVGKLGATESLLFAFKLKSTSGNTVLNLPDYITCSLVKPDTTQIKDKCAETDFVFISDFKTLSFVGYILPSCKPLTKETTFAKIKCKINDNAPELKSGELTFDYFYVMSKPDATDTKNPAGKLVTLTPQSVVFSVKSTAASSTTLPETSQNFQIEPKSVECPSGTVATGIRGFYSEVVTTFQLECGKSVHSSAVGLSGKEAVSKSKNGYFVSYVNQAKKLTGLKTYYSSSKGQIDRIVSFGDLYADSEKGKTDVNVLFCEQGQAITKVNLKVKNGQSIYNVTGVECVSVVTSNVCGNGKLDLDAGEVCDDKNNNDGDGCSSKCAMESGFTCTGSPSVCFKEICTDGIDNDGDGNTDCADTGCYGSKGKNGAACCSITAPCLQGQSCVNNECVLSSADTDKDGVSDSLEPKVCVGVGEKEYVYLTGDSAGCPFGDTDKNGCVSVSEYTIFKGKYKSDSTTQNLLKPDIYTIYKAKYKGSNTFPSCNK